MILILFSPFSAWRLTNFYLNKIELLQLTGVAAILRFPMPELEEDIPLSDSDDDNNENDNYKAHAAVPTAASASNTALIDTCDTIEDNHQNGHLSNPSVASNNTRNSNEMEQHPSTSASTSTTTTKGQPISKKSAVKRFNKENYAKNRVNDYEDQNDDDDEDFHYSSKQASSNISNFNNYRDDDDFFW